MAQPTEAELSILDVLWRQGASTVRQVHEDLQERQHTGYTTTLKLMQIMAQKGLATRDESQRSHLYLAAVDQAGTQQGLVRQLADKVFAGSAGRLALSALASEQASPEELTAIRELLDQLGAKQGKARPRRASGEGRS